MNVIYDKVARPVKHTGYVPVPLTKQTMEEHREKVLSRMQKLDLDVLMVYADREHGANYAYLTGFEPRFEESVLVLHKDGTCFLMFGNENLKMVRYSFIPATAIHIPHFSLPNQPMETEKTVEELFQSAGIANGQRIGCVGWKCFTSRLDNNESLFDVPAFIVDAVRKINPDGKLINTAGIFLNPVDGARMVMNANEVAHYEYGAGLASTCIMDVLEAVEPGKTELELGALLAPNGQPNNVTTICATGERFTDAVVFPRNKKVVLGDKFSVTLGLRGGLTSRAAYVVNGPEELPENVKDYMDKVVCPYFKAAVTWYETVGLGVSGQAVYDAIQEVLPKEKHNWMLNPGHYTGADEWVASPVFPGSTAVLESGMLLQMDILPSVPGYGSANAEDGIALADEALRKEIQEKYPEAWARIQDRRTYMKEVLNIALKDEVLPLSDMCGYLRPYLLNHASAMKKACE